MSKRLWITLAIINVAAVILNAVGFFNPVFADQPLTRDTITSGVLSLVGFIATFAYIGIIKSYFPASNRSLRKGSKE